MARFFILILFIFLPACSMPKSLTPEPVFPVVKARCKMNMQGEWKCHIVNDRTKEYSKDSYCYDSSFCDI